MTTPTVIETRRNGNHVGERIELGRYRTDAGVERVLYGQRVATVVRVTDVPVDHPGRAYLVERGLEEDGYAALLALVAGLSRSGESARHPADVDDGSRVGPTDLRDGSSPTHAGTAYVTVSSTCS